MAAASSACPHPSLQLSQQQVMPPRMRTLLISVPGALGRLWGKCHGVISVDFPIVTFSLLPTGLLLTYRLCFVFHYKECPFGLSHQDSCGFLLSVSNFVPPLLWNFTSLSFSISVALNKSLSFTSRCFYPLIQQSIEKKSMCLKGIVLNDELNSLGFSLFSYL